MHCFSLFIGFVEVILLRVVSILIRNAILLGVLVYFLVLYGPALALQDTVAHIANVTFHLNTVTAISEFGGGALYAYCGSYAIEGCTFTSNAGLLVASRCKTHVGHARPRVESARMHRRRKAARDAQSHRTCSQHSRMPIPFAHSFHFSDFRGCAGLLAGGRGRRASGEPARCPGVHFRGQPREQLRR